MLIKQIICNIIMFATYIANIAWVVYTLVKLPKTMKILSSVYTDLTDVEEYKLHQQHFFHKYFLMLLTSLVSLIVVAVTTVSDGLSNTEQYLVAPAFVIIFGTVALLVFFRIYYFILKKKYKIRTRHSQMRFSRRNGDTGQLAVEMILSGLLAGSTGVMVYTTILLFV